MPRPACLVALTLLALAGCSRGDRPAMPATCVEGAANVERALGAAPGEVRLGDGTPLSRCVERARTDSELQNLGIVLTQVAEDLEARAGEDSRAALELGYLVGAARRGAPGESMLQTELVRRLERSAAALDGAAVRALTDGIRAGEARG